MIQTPLYSSRNSTPLAQQAFPAASGTIKKTFIGIGIASIVTAIAIAIIFMISISAIGPILWGVAPSAAALLAGKILTYITIAAVGLDLIALALSCCSISFLSSCVSSCAALGAFAEDYDSP